MILLRFAANRMSKMVCCISRSNSYTIKIYITCDLCNFLPRMTYMLLLGLNLTAKLHPNLATAFNMSLSDVTEGASIATSSA